MQSPPTDVPPGASPSMLLTSAEKSKKKQKERRKEEDENVEKNTLYDIVSSPLKDSARLTLKLSRVKNSEAEQFGKSPPGADDLMNTDNQLLSSDQDLSCKLGAEEQANSHLVPFQSNTKESGCITEVVLDDAEIDTLAEIERTERESVSERERWSKEVQDKGTFLCFCLCPVSSCISS